MQNHQNGSCAEGTYFSYNFIVITDKLELGRSNFVWQLIMFCMGFSMFCVISWIKIWHQKTLSQEVSRQQATDIFLVCNRVFILMFLYSGEKLDT
jgi:hypothetical protein